MNLFGHSGERTSTDVEFAGTSIPSDRKFPANLGGKGAYRAGEGDTARRMIEPQTSSAALAKRFMSRDCSWLIEESMRSLKRCSPFGEPGSNTRVAGTAATACTTTLRARTRGADAAGKHDVRGWVHALRRGIRLC